MENTSGNTLRRYTLQGNNAKLLGRTYIYEEVLWLAYSAAGAEFEFEGTECIINFIGDNMATATIDKTHYARVAVYVNEALVVEDVIDKERKSYQVYQDNMSQRIKIRIIKLSETTDSTVGIESVQICGSNIMPTKMNKLKLEFIGDSITCGYGVDGGLSDIYSTANENAAKAYAYKTATALEADYSMVSISGYGIVSGYTETGDKNATDLLLPYYDKLGMSYGKFASQLEPSSITWDFIKFIPDMIIINLGTNDQSYCRQDIIRCEEFQHGYKNFVSFIREKNPHAYILCTLGMMGDYLYPYVEQAVANHIHETNDNKISCMKFDVQAEADGYAVDYHPTEITNNKASEKLVRHLRSIMGINSMNK